MRSCEAEKLILSFLGIDSGSGGCPSPIFPDGTIFSLPIPPWDDETFKDLPHSDVGIVSVVTGTTDGRMNGSDQIHYNPPTDAGMSLSSSFSGAPPLSASAMGSSS